MRAFVMLACLLTVPTTANAALDPELDKPYTLEVVLHFADHRLLTGVFKDQVERELLDSLQVSFREVAKITVARPDPKNHPRLRDILAKGLQVVDGWKEVSNVKTHFVLVGYRDGQYEIQARQFDGLTGQPSRVIRRVRTADRQFVARAAALQVGQDFGVVGTLTDIGNPAETGNQHVVQMKLKAATLTHELDRLVRKDDVFSLVQIKQDSAGLWRVPVDDAYLQVEEVGPDGTCQCRLSHRFRDPLGSPGAVGYRCLKLATVQTPVRMRLVRGDSKTLIPQAGLQVHIQHFGFQDQQQGIEQRVSDGDGYVTSQRSYDRLAFVTVRSEGNVQARIPVALVDDNVVVAAVAVAAEADPSSYRQREIWLNRLFDSLETQRAILKELRDLVAKTDREAVLAKVKGDLKNLETDLSGFRSEQAQLQKAAAHDPAVKRALQQGQEVLDELEKARTNYTKLEKALQEILVKENSPARKDATAKFEQGRLAENEADFGKAIELYKQALAGDFSSRDDLRKKIADLEAGWKLKGEPHRKARAYIYDTWPSVDVVTDRDAVGDARKAFEACRSVADKLTPQKLLKASITHVGRLQKELANLKPNVREDDAKAAEALTKVIDDLAKLIKEVTDYLR